MKIANKEIAHLLRSVAATYLLGGVDRFRIIAYDNAADAVEHLNRELYDLWQNGELAGIPGIGPSISAHLDEYFKKGDASYLVKTVHKIPEAVFVLMKVPGIGAKKAFKLTQALKLASAQTAIPDLLRAARDNKIAKLETFGEKSQSDIISSIELYLAADTKSERMPLPYAYTLAQEVIAYLGQHPKVKKVDALGSLRRMVATIGDIDLAAVTSDPKAAPSMIDHFTRFPGTQKIEGKGDKKASITLANGRQIDLRVTDPESYGAMLQYFTGSKAHNIRLREYGLKKGFSLSEYGIGDKAEKGTVGRSKHFATEAEFYKFLDLPLIPPEIREGTDEIELAAKNRLPHLVALPDIKGEFHVHSNYNLEPSHDLGTSSMDELIKKAQSLNYEYLAISDHNPSQSNHTHDQIISIMKKRYETLKKFHDKFPIIVSCEVDILPDGGIALPAGALDYVDMIVVSIHSSFRQNKPTMTARLLKALATPKVKVLGHPTGRMLPSRAEIDADWPAIFVECKKRGIALEINSWPGRLDLPDILVRQAKEVGNQFVINTDAHAAAQMDNMFYGVSVARRGWLTKNDIINTRDYKEVEEWLNKK